MKKLLLLLFVFVLILFSCSKEKDDDGIIQMNESNSLSDRLEFSSFREMLNLYAELAKKDPNELIIWAKTKKHSTLLESPDTTIMNYSNALKTILNKDFEFQVGDSIIKFYYGEFLAFPKYESQSTDLSKMKKIGSVELSKKQSSEKGVISIYAGQRDATPQHEFIITQYIPCNGPPEYNIFGYRKYVCDLYHEFITYYQYYQSTAWLRIKLEYRTSIPKWYICFNEHLIDYHIYGTAIFYTYCEGWEMESFAFDCSQSYVSCPDVLTVPLNVYLASRSGMCYDISNVTQWIINISGSITQQINGDPHPWTFSSSQWPWWGM